MVHQSAGRPDEDGADYDYEDSSDSDPTLVKDYDYEDVDWVDKTRANADTKAVKDDSDERSRAAVVEVEEEDRIISNVSPIDRGHSLLLPAVNLCQPQVRLRSVADPDPFWIRI